MCVNDIVFKKHLGPRVFCLLFFTCKNLLISFLQFFPVKGFSHLGNDLRTDVSGKCVRLWRVCEVAYPSATTLDY